MTTSAGPRTHRRHRPTSVLLADDHPLVRDGLARALARDGRFDVLAQAADGRMAVELAKRLNPDLAVLDVRMPGLDGIHAMKAIHDRRPHTKVVLLSAFQDDAVIRAALEDGAAGYLAKGIDRADLCDAIALAAAGETVLAAGSGPAAGDAHPPGLTAREHAVLTLTREGHDAELIASLVGIEPEDVARCLRRVTCKLEADDRGAGRPPPTAWCCPPGS